MHFRDVQVRSALLSVYHKTGLDVIVQRLHQLGVRIYATGGTADFVRNLGIEVVDLSGVTGYPSILGGRVKTLHPAIFGGILARRENESDLTELATHNIGTFDLVLVDLYPFADTVQSSKDEAEIIEKIDIGGVSLLRAAAKNHSHVVVVPSVDHYAHLLALLNQQDGRFTYEQRKQFALASFAVTNQYDGQIHDWFASTTTACEATSTQGSLRYGENPHQQARFQGKLTDMVTQLAGKDLSYNNLLDLDGALRLLVDLDRLAAPGEAACAIIKHTSPCGAAIRSTPLEAWEAALASDPTSAFGGIIVLNQPVDLPTAQRIHEQFYEVLCAPAFAADAVQLLAQKKNRILLTYKHLNFPAQQVRSALTGQLVQQADAQVSEPAAWNIPTTRKPDAAQTADLAFAEVIAKHLKSNAISIVKDRQLLGGGMGQTSRIDSLRHAIEKVQAHGHSTIGAVLASDGFFPFADGVEHAHKAGIEVVLQPGGAMRDEEVVQFCQQHNMCMVLTGQRHFRH